MKSYLEKKIDQESECLHKQISDEPVSEIYLKVWISKIPNFLCSLVSSPKSWVKFQLLYQIDLLKQSTVETAVFMK